MRAARPTRPSGRALVLALGLVPVLAGCGAAGTTVAAPTPSGSAATRCAALVDSLPTTVAGTASRPVLPPSPYAAAWGDPPIVLRCGVSPPAALEPTSQVFTIDGVDWFAERGDGRTTFTTVGRVTGVEVSVPAAYAPEAAVLTELAPAISRAVPTA